MKRWVWMWAVPCLLCPAQAAVRYVSSASGVDAGNATDPAAPCATIQYAVDQSGDGEYIADTVPTDGEPYLCVTHITHASPFAVCFDSRTGRLYTLEGASNLVAGVWTNVPGGGPRMGLGGEDSMDDTNEPAAGPFYRLEVESP